MVRILVLMVLLSVLSGCGGRLSGRFAKESGTVARDPVTVKVMEVGKSSKTGEARYIGKVEPSRSTILSSRYGGTLSSLKVSEGQAVSAGQAVAEVFSENVKSTYDMAMATLAQAEDGYARVKSVYDIGAVAQVKMVEVETQLAKAKASAQAARKALEDCTIKAPYKGVISEVYADEGVEISIGTPLVRLVDMTSLEIVFSLPENEYPSVSLKDTAYVEVPAIGKTLLAKVAAKGFSASDLSHGYKVRLSLSGDTKGLMPGMACKVALSPDKGEEDVIAVPSSSIRTDGSGRYVWVVREGKAQKAPVVTGGFSGGGVIVAEGLSEGDLVIVEGMRNVSSGMTVKVVL
ncbi:MAG: efflux RND transporter periplasmic adaptor subunit [Candidatus Cryptobacteroides sp.]